MQQVFKKNPENDLPNETKATCGIIREEIILLIWKIGIPTYTQNNGVNARLLVIPSTVAVKAAAAAAAAPAFTTNLNTNS